MEQAESQEWLDPLAERQLIPEDCRAAYLVGSAARGWHNSKSDFDIYIIAASEWMTETSNPIPMPLNPPHVQSEAFYLNGRRWELTYWLDTQVDQMLTKVSWDEFGRELVARDVLTQREELFLARLANSLPILGEDWVERAQERLNESAFRSFLVARSLGSADDAIEDALGQMEAGDLASATLSARRALGYAVDALLEGHGEFGSNIPKWRPQRLKAAQPSMLSFETYWALETMQAYDPSDPSVWINEVLTLCQDISMRVDTA